MRRNGGGGGGDFGGDGDGVSGDACGDPGIVVLVMVLVICGDGVGGEEIDGSRVIGGSGVVLLFMGILVIV